MGSLSHGLIVVPSQEANTKNIAIFFYFLHILVRLLSLLIGTTLISTYNIHDKISLKIRFLEQLEEFRRD